MTYCDVSRQECAESLASISAGEEPYQLLTQRALRREPAGIVAIEVQQAERRQHLVCGIGGLARHDPQARSDGALLRCIAAVAPVREPPH